MAAFKYDIVILIALIESKPCIWDKSNEHNKNRIFRNKCWQEIFLLLEDGYEQLSQAEQKATGETIMAKWSNIRDCFLRSLRTKRGQKPRKEYLYSEHLQFLMNTAQKDETESNFSQAGTEDDSIEFVELSESQMPTASSGYLPESSPHLTYPSTSSEYRTKKRPQDDRERDIFSELKKEKQSVELCSHHPRSDHEMLLLSFLPYIRDMSETELMDMQMRVLTIIKEIKQQRV